MMLDKARVKETLADQGWRLNHLYQITDKDGKKIPFQMNWAQQQFFENLHTNNIILKARQLGFSTFINLLQLDTALFVPNTACGVIAHTDDAAKELFQRNIKFPYDHLPDAAKKFAPTQADSAHQYRFANGSSIRVATSMRSGTIQILHVSEFGKICAQFPQRAREIVTGSLETVGQGNIVVIESTAEGNEGYFHDYCQTAKALADGRKKLARADYRFFFFPWWQEPAYRLTGSVIIDDHLQRYFERVEADIGQTLDAGQRKWYAAKRERLGEDVFREYPSTPEEAFWVSTEGSYYAQQLARARKEGRIGRVPLDSRAPLNTFWDIGIDDATAIWLHQEVGSQHRFVGYIEGSGEPLQYYVNRVREHAGSVVMGTHHLPHDAAKRDPKDGKTYQQIAESLGLRPIKIVQTPDLLAGIQATRDLLSAAYFDEERCAIGLKRLQGYRKDWNERMGCFADRPRHDDNSHGADALRQWAQGYRAKSPSARPMTAPIVYDTVAGY